MDTPGLLPSNSSLIPTQNNNPATHWQCPVQEWSSHPVLTPGERGVSAGLGCVGWVSICHLQAGYPKAWWQDVVWRLVFSPLPPPLSWPSTWALLPMGPCLHAGPAGLCADKTTSSDQCCSDCRIYCFVSVSSIRLSAPGWRL